MSAGHIQARGAGTWRIKFEVDRDPATGKRRIQYVTVKGTRKQAQAELTRLLAARDAGTAVEPDKITVGDYLRTSITTAETIAISPKTAERNPSDLISPAEGRRQGDANPRRRRRPACARSDEGDGDLSAGYCLGFERHAARRTYRSAMAGHRSRRQDPPDRALDREDEGRSADQRPKQIMVGAG